MEVDEAEATTPLACDMLGKFEGGRVTVQMITRLVGGGRASFLSAASSVPQQERVSSRSATGALPFARGVSGFFVQCALRVAVTTGPCSVFLFTRSGQVMWTSQPASPLGVAPCCNSN